MKDAQTTIFDLEELEEEGDTVCILDREGKLHSSSPEEIMREDVLNEIYRSRLKIRRFEEDDRMICVSEKL